MTDSNDFFDDLEAEAEETPPVADLESVRAMAVEAVMVQTEIEGIEARLKKLKSKRYDLLSKQMPAAMDEMRVPFIGVQGYRLDVITHYKAAIKADDPEDQRDRAFAWVEAAGGGDIVNNVVTVAFPKEEAEAAREFAEEVSNRFHNQQGVTVGQEKTVPWNRLTSWLKEYVEAPPTKTGPPKLPVPVDDLNASIGRVVKIKALKED